LSDTSLGTVIPREPRIHIRTALQFYLWGMLKVSPISLILQIYVHMTAVWHTKFRHLPWRNVVKHSLQHCYATHTTQRVKT